jgi:proteasome beta subunit
VIRVAVEALYDAADDDSATGGPDLVRKIYPVIMLATAEGTARVPDDEVGQLAEAVIAERTANPV